jgi:hypothetical protein
MTEAIGTFAGKQSGVYKAMFVASKAFAVAQSVVSITSGIAQALNNPFPANLAFAASVAAQGATLLTTIRGTNYGGGRQYGGPVSAGSLYRINETGMPEMFTGSNGSQYMLPNRAGSVTPADKVAGGVEWTIIVNEAPPGMRASVDNEARIVSFAVAQAEANFVSQVSGNSGPMWNAMRGASNVQGRL